MKFRSALCFCLAFVSSALYAHGEIDASQHSIQMVPVENGVHLEVLDWGGTGRPLVLLTGLADNAHIFDQFAPKLTAQFHVFGISRRGRGASSTPTPEVRNYTAGRLGEDVLAVIDALHLDKPILVGHSIAGEELSYIGSHYPEKVAGVVYLEAGYPYALYDQANGELELDAIHLRKQLGQFTNGYAQEPVNDYEGLRSNLALVEKEIKQHEDETRDLPPTPVSQRMTPDLFAIMEGRERFETIHTPALVIFATDPASVMGDDPQSRAQAARQALSVRQKEQQIEAFKRQVPQARIVLIPRGTHYVFQSNEIDVLREIKSFAGSLASVQ